METRNLPPALRAVLEPVAAALRGRESAIVSRVSEQRMVNPTLTPEQLVQKLIRDTRRRVAATGAASGAAAVVPGIGTGLAVGAVTSQALWALEQEAELVMAIALVHGHQLETTDDRIIEALVIIGIAGGAVKLRDTVLVAGGQAMTVEAFRRVPSRFLAAGGGRALGRLVARIGTIRAAASVSRLAPVAVGLTIGAAFDWVVVSALGRAASAYYGRALAPGAITSGALDAEHFAYVDMRD